MMIELKYVSDDVVIRMGQIADSVGKVGSRQDTLLGTPSFVWHQGRRA